MELFWYSSNRFLFANLELTETFDMRLWETCWRWKTISIDKDWKQNQLILKHIYIA